MNFPTIKPWLKQLLLVLVVIVNIIIWLVFFTAVAVRVSPQAQQLGNDLWIRYLMYSFDNATKRDYELATQDTTGGKTPEETLRLYITAVEGEDYKLAGKYFITTKQEKESASFRDAKSEDIKILLDYLKQAADRIPTLEQSWKTREEFVITKPILVRFVKYPSGNWKIIEI